MSQPVNQLTLGYCGGNGHSTFPFNGIFAKKQDIALGMDGVDAVVFWGGSDIHPSLYGEKDVGTWTGVGSGPSARDLFEVRAAKWCIMNGIPMIGVCRGMQLLCAMAGGTLIQDVTHHNHGYHNIRTHDDKVFSVTSAHHQMLFPWNVEHTLLAWSEKPLSKHYYNGKNCPIGQAQTSREPEAIYFPKIKGIGIQGHPEWMNATDEAVLWFNKEIASMMYDHQWDKADSLEGV